MVSVSAVRHSCWAFITWICLMRGTCSVILHDVLVPAVIQNGTVPFVVLDCHYSMNHSEKDGMILKWYLNGRTVYQWIPPTHPQGLGDMRGKINLDYEISPDPYGRHRALYLYSPTTDMSGDYTCKISTLQNEVSQTKKMVIYVPPRRVQMMHQKCSLDHVNITCMADYVFPEPSVKLFHGKTNERVRLKGVEERHARYFGGAWQKVVFVVLSDKSLQQAENVFECEVSLPHTEFVTKKATIYSPSNPTVMASASNATPGRSLRWHKVLMWSLLCLFRTLDVS